jgi:hypothetical protein
MRRSSATIRPNTTGVLSQCEWATDILFRPGTLARLSPLLLEHGMLSFSSPDVLQFPGHRINVDGQIPRNYTGELTTDFKSRASGDRVKYRIDGNSLKGYGKAGTPLGDLYRVETLTQHPEVFKTYRPAEGGPEDDLKWRIMRRGVADRHRRCEVSQKANERYWDALSTVDDSTRFSELTRDLEQPCHASIRDAASARFTPSRPTIIHCSWLSIVGNSPSMG